MPCSCNDSIVKPRRNEMVVEVEMFAVREANAPFAQVCKYCTATLQMRIYLANQTPSEKQTYFEVLASVVSCQFFGTAASLSFTDSRAPCCSLTCCPAATARSVLA